MKFIKAIFVGLFIVVGVAHADTSYTVTYSCGDGTGTPPENATAYENTSFTPATNSCSKTGHTFAGWGVSDTNDVVNEPFTWEYTENKTLTATWTPNTYNITLSNIPALPAGYTQLEYLESTGTQYIDTGVIPTNSTGLKVKFNRYVKGDQVVVGISAADVSTFYVNPAVGLLIPFGTSWGGTSCGVTQNNFDYEVMVNYENDRKRYVNGESKLDITTNLIPTIHSMYLFAGYYSAVGGAAWQFIGRIYYLQVTEGLLLIHNFIPARRDSDGELGMYDTVSGTFFTNDGTGTFIAGSIVPEVLTSNTQTYTYGVGNTVNSEPTRNGYTFAGWCMDAELQNCAMTQTIGTTDTGDKTYYAKWNGNVFNITWNGVDAADVAANNAGTMTYGENIRTPRVAPAERPGQQFLGWRFRPAVQ